MRQESEGQFKEIYIVRALIYYLDVVWVDWVDKYEEESFNIRALSTRAESLLWDNSNIIIQFNSLLFEVVH